MIVNIELFIDMENIRQKIQDILLKEVSNFNNKKHLSAYNQLRGNSFGDKLENSLSDLLTLVKDKMKTLDIEDSDQEYLFNELSDLLDELLTAHSTVLSLRAKNRNIIEISAPDEYYTMEDEFAFNTKMQQAPVAIDFEGLKEFLDQEGIFGIESDLVSILEGFPTDSVKSEIESYTDFKEEPREVEDMSVEEMMEAYLESKHLDRYKEEILSFGMSSY